MARMMAAHSTSSSRVVAKKRPFGDGSTPVPGAAYALQSDGDGSRRADLADEVDVADVDAEFERGGGDEDAALTLLETALGLKAEMARERAMMGGDMLLAHALGEAVRDALDEAASVDEDESGAMLECEFVKAVVNLAPHFIGGDGAKLGRGKLDGKIERSGGGNDDGDWGVAIFVCRCVFIFAVGKRMWGICDCDRGAFALVVASIFAKGRRMWATLHIDRCRCIGRGQNRLLVEELGAVCEI